ncbi:hypothetical protein DUI87_01953 [Hirundo rustica rustica]|uniref:Uncharacterized protein n=1 Tax=Hirundo rustica rustica TaxID=333673 RepID=A0A3M0L801_HIRRU|nr:hypothetical protein DUI87_01953 [Hirundo rustica rustica]
MWVCQQIGITPCVYLSKLNNLADFCVQVLIVPRVLYHQEEEMYRFLEETILLRKREVITGITIAMFLGLGATGTATGVSALVTQHQRLSQLQMTIDKDLLRIEKSISLWKDLSLRFRKSSCRTGEDWTSCSCSKEACVPP